jgi:biopolymer transport protein ExbD
MFRRPKKTAPSSGDRESYLIPVLSIMFMLVPALLLAMQVASMAAINVHPPLFVPNTSGQPGEDDDLLFQVMIAEDGFYTTIAGARLGDGAPDIALRAGAAADDLYDYGALEARARDLKQQYPHASRVGVTAEGSVSLQTLVRSMDALRGRDCALEAVHRGERAPDTCLFWDVIVES